MPEPSVTLQASQIDGAIIFIAVAIAFVVVLMVIEVVEGLFGKKKKRK